MASFLTGLSLSARILIGLVLGVATGLFFGEMTAPLGIGGAAFVGLLQMTVLPYITFSLIANIGRLNPEVARRFGAWVATFLGASLLITVAAVVILPLALPLRESASFFSTSLVAEPEKLDLLNLFIPRNPFESLATNTVPAVVVFSIALGLAGMGLPNKERALEQLDFFTASLARINQALVQLTPLGVFAIAAEVAGTMELAEIQRLRAYLLLFAAASLFLAYGVLLPLLAATTPFTYRQLVIASRAPVLTAFSTGKVFIVLPLLIDAAERLFEEAGIEPEEPKSHVGAVVPLAYSFPHAGKLLVLLFLPFVAWFVGQRIPAAEYPAILAAGTFGLFGSPLATIPFLLGVARLPSDLFQLFVASGVLTSRLGDLLGAVHLLFVSVLTACALTGRLRVSPQRLLVTSGAIVVAGGLVFAGLAASLARTESGEYHKDDEIAQMHSSIYAVPSIVHETPPPPRGRGEETTLERIRRTGVMRVGYRVDLLPQSFLNADGELVGYDIDMASLLARQLGVELEFVPIEALTVAGQLEQGVIDIATSALPMIPHFLEIMRFVGPVTYATVSVIVPDHRREEFERRIEERDFSGVTVAVVEAGDTGAFGQGLIPGARFVPVSHPMDFLAPAVPPADALVWSAESGAAFTLLYPQFGVVPLRPIFRIPLGYVVPSDDPKFAEFITHWLELTASGPLDERLYEHWILGQAQQDSGPRWSVVRDVLHWVE